MKVLLMYISMNSGHHRATLAIEEAIKLLDPGAEIMNINALNYTNPMLEKVITKTYLRMIRKRPEVWGYLYDNPEVLKKTQKLRELIHRFNSKKLKTLLEEFKPDVVGCTQAFPCGMVADYKKTFSSHLPLFGILTDYLPHSYWFYDTVDYYIVPSKPAMERFILAGVTEKNIREFGIPIDHRFKNSLDKEEICARLNLDKDIPIILVMGGGQGMGSIKDVALSLNRSEMPMQILVVAGLNKRLHKWFRKEKGLFPKKVVAFSYVKNIDELMEISTLIITKPGGLTTAEALTKGLPLIVVNPIPGQETNNTEYLLNEKVALEADTAEDVKGLAEDVLSSPGKLNSMRSQTLSLAKPNASVDIAKMMLCRGGACPHPG